MMCHATGHPAQTKQQQRLPCPNTSVSGCMKMTHEADLEKLNQAQQINNGVAHIPTSLQH